MKVNIKWIGEPTRIAPVRNGEKVDVETNDVIACDVDQARMLAKMYKDKIILSDDIDTAAGEIVSELIKKVGSLTNKELKEAKEAIDSQITKNSKNGKKDEKPETPKDEGKPEKKDEKPEVAKSSK